MRKLIIPGMAAILILAVAGIPTAKVNKNWRLTFTFAGGDAGDVNFEDYH